jgi:hypothetical protein
VQGLRDRRGAPAQRGQEARGEEELLGVARLVRDRGSAVRPAATGLRAAEQVQVHPHRPRGAPELAVDLALQRHEHACTLVRGAAGSLRVARRSSSRRMRLVMLHVTRRARRRLAANNHSPELTVSLQE